ncbi:MAG: class I SAM-dependent methyltransferase [Chloroflexota bacterium]
MNNSTPPVCNYDGSDYQTSFWDEGARAYEDEAEAVALKRLLPAQGSLLLEVGAGAGRNTSRYGGFERIVLLDYSYTQLQQARERLGDSQRYVYVAANVYCLPFIPGLFGTATMIRTLHHMADPKLALKQIHHVMRPDGVFILEYANKQNLKAILRYLLRRQPWSPFSHDPVEFAPLNFDFHPQAVCNWLKESGFTIEQQLTVSHFRMDWLKRLLPTRLLVNLDSLAQWTGNAWQLSPSVFVRSHAVGDTPTTPLEAFFRCPACEYWPLLEADGLLPCTNCGAQWQFKDGIYDFREPAAV